MQDDTGTSFLIFSMSPSDISPTHISSRDDLTVEVIFFGESDKSGDVVLNAEASAPGLGIKAKL